MPTVIKLRTKTAPAECKPCQANRELQLSAAEQKVDRRPPLPEDQPAATRVTWSGPIIFEGQMTGDGRYIEPNALTWDNLPAPLRFAREDTGEHNGAVVVGRILTITRKPGGVIWGTGDFDTVHPDSIEAARQVREQLSNGVSADLDNVSFEVRVARELIEGDSIPGEPDDEDETKVDENGRVTVLDIDADAEVMDIDDARIRAATLVAVPAFEGARIELDDPADADDRLDDDPDQQPEDEPAEDQDRLVAASAPKLPPARWFSDPKLEGPTPLTVTDDGRIFGHLAKWDSCHTAFSKECVSPPRSPSGYGYFRTGVILTDDGFEIPVGHITLDTFHAGKQLGPADTIAHYEHTGATVADVAAGEDSYGIWVAGALRHNLSDDHIRSLRSSPLSGDWRRIGGQLELVAALAVNVPGFPVPRAQGVLAASGAMQSLVASGVVQRVRRSLDSVTYEADRDEESVSAEALNYLRKLTANDHNRLRAAKLRRRVRSVELERRVKSLRSTAKTSTRGGQ